jgi:hypothetical protein
VKWMSRPSGSLFGSTDGFVLTPWVPKTKKPGKSVWLARTLRNESGSSLKLTNVSADAKPLASSMMNVPFFAVPFDTAIAGVAPMTGDVGSPLASRHVTGLKRSRTATLAPVRSICPRSLLAVSRMSMIPVLPTSHVTAAGADAAPHSASPMAPASAAPAPLALVRSGRIRGPRPTVGPARRPRIGYFPTPAALRRRAHELY